MVEGAAIRPSTTNGTLSPPPDKLILKVDERKEDEYFAKVGEERLKTYSKKKSLTDEQVWGKNKSKKSLKRK